MGLRVLIAALALASCYRPHPTRCQYYCADDEAQSCPDGLTCNSEHICAQSGSDLCGGIIGGVDASADGDRAQDDSGSAHVACTLAFGSELMTPTSFSPDSVAIVDFDGDGAGDLALAFAGSSHFNEYNGNGNGSFAARGSGLSEALAKPVTNVAMISLGFTAGSGVAITYGDASGGGIQEFCGTPGVDLVQTDPTQAPTGSARSIGVASAVNSDDGGLPNVISVTTDATSTTAWTYYNVNNDLDSLKLALSSSTTGLAPKAVAMATGDVDNSTRSDLVIVYANSTFQVIHDPYIGHVAVESPQSYAGTPGAAALAALEGSGLDLVIATTTGIVVARNQNNGAPDPFAPAQQVVATAMAPTSMVAADFNDDGYADIAVADAGSDDVLVFESLGNGTFASPYPIATPPGVGSIAAGYLDHDVLPDLVITYSTGFAALLNHCQ